jgi:SAM-dependent methyltransferase
MCNSNCRQSANVLQSICKALQYERLNRMTPCSICGTDQSLFTKTADRTPRICSECHSVERHRVFMDLCRSGVIAPIDGTVLIVAPSLAERRLFEALGVKIVTTDVRPQVKADFVANVCSMPEVATASFDHVFASSVMRHLYDLDAGLAEMTRVMKPGGRLMLTEFFTTGRATAKVESERITSWYGQENLERYRVGNFWILGDDFPDILSKHLSVEKVSGFDEAMSVTIDWYIGTKHYVGVQPNLHLLENDPRGKLPL